MIKTIQVSAKCEDFMAHFYDENGHIVKEIEGSIPPLFDGMIGSVDYITFAFDVRSGKILSFIPPSQNELENV